MVRVGKSRETQGRRYLEALPRIFAKEAALVVVPSGASCEWTDQDAWFFAACVIEPCSQEWVRVTDAAGSGLGTYDEGARLIGVRSAKHYSRPDRLITSFAPGAATRRDGWRIMAGDGFAVSVRAFPTGRRPWVGGFRCGKGEDFLKGV